MGGHPSDEEKERKTGDCAAVLQEYTFNKCIIIFRQIVQSLTGKMRLERLKIIYFLKI